MIVRHFFTYGFVKLRARNTQLGRDCTQHLLPWDFHHVVPRMTLRYVPVASEELRVGMRTVVVEDFLAGLDVPQRRDGECVVAVVNVRLIPSVVNSNLRN